MTPVADGGVRNLYVKSGAENEADITERAFAEVEHRESGNNHKDRIAHTLEA